MKLDQAKERDPHEIGVLLTDREKKIEAFLQRLGTVKNMRIQHDKEKQQKRKEKLEKQKEEEEERRQEAIRKSIKRRKMK
jgi:hypothetical protein